MYLKSEYDGSPINAKFSIVTQQEMKNNNYTVLSEKEKKKHLPF